ncbi:hypothetical protein SOM59_20855, partial [Pseudomonas coleopterorum]|uniref:hypothetical protein n=1 Tax=Pseudomonas coleopterorum TaxID=1605838 RepID=UPI002A6A8F41
SAVKRCIADGSVGFPHVRVGHRQDSIPKPLSALAGRGFVFLEAKITTLKGVFCSTLAYGSVLFVVVN